MTSSPLTHRTFLAGVALLLAAAGFSAAQSKTNTDAAMKTRLIMGRILERDPKVLAELPRFLKEFPSDKAYLLSGWLLSQIPAQLGLRCLDKNDKVLALDGLYFGEAPAREGSR
jgi:hypothetical protein